MICQSNNYSQNNLISKLSISKQINLKTDLFLNQINLKLTFSQQIKFSTNISKQNLNQIFSKQNFQNKFVLYKKQTNSSQSSIFSNLQGLNFSNQTS